MFSTYQPECQAWKESASWKWWSCLACFLGILYVAGDSPEHHHSCQQPPAPFWLRLVSFPSSEPQSEPGSWPSRSETSRKSNTVIKCTAHLNTVLKYVIFDLWWRFTTLWGSSAQNCFWVFFSHWTSSKYFSLICASLFPSHMEFILNAYLMMQIISDWMLRLSRYEEVSWNHTSPYKKN